MAGYRQKVERTTAEANASSRVGRDIADGYPRPARGAARRRAVCERDLRKFFESYFPEAFRLEWSADHLRVIGRLQEAILHGGLFAVAMPRGAGKSTMAERGALWALLFGHRRFVVLIGATEYDAARLLGHLKTELLNNERLARDFRHVTYPVRRIENNARRCIGQLFKGRRTDITWGADRITFPTMPDEACDGANVSGATVATAGLTGAIRGLSHTLASGEITRPDMVLLDDVQTRESSGSPLQTTQRLAIVQGDVLGLAGPAAKITALALVTVISAGDLADQLLDRERSPQWHGERTAAVYAWPENEPLWAEYLKIRAEAQRRGESTEAATAFYRRNRQAMDAGALVAWPARKFPEELSAVEHVMGLRADLGEAAFASEYQNEPQRAEAEADAMLTAEEIMGRLNGLPRGLVPRAATMLSAFVDVHNELLFWVIVGWETNFTGSIVGYGTVPKQRARLFSLRKADPTLPSVYPGAGREGAILAGLKAFDEEILSRQWPREGSSPLPIQLCLVDCGFLPDLVEEFCKRSPRAAVLLPSRGEGVGAARRPMTEYQVKPGERHGWYWLVAPTAHRGIRRARFDANHYKSFVHNHLALALGDKGSLTLYGNDPEEHRLFAQHLTAEAPIMVSANGRTVAEWRPRPGAGDNHWLDTLCGAAVAASMAGAATEGREPTPATGRGKQKSYRDLWEEARARRNGGR
jgi:hypothetical protein